MQKYSPRREITVPKVTRDLLMFPPSFNLRPVAPEASAFSLYKTNDIKF